MSTTSIKMRRPAIAVIGRVALVALTLFYSCSKEKSGADNFDKAGVATTYENIAGRPPAFVIRESEKLEIPGTIVLPDNLPNGNSRVATYYAEGVQKYKAQPRAGTDPVIYDWVLFAPQAYLYDFSNKLVGTHSAGPSWQLTGTMDSIFGQHFIPARTAPSPDPSSIDWLLLMPKAGKIPTGKFAEVDYIQRIATQGGKAPATPPVSAAETIDIPYTAVYRFSKINP